MNCAKWNALRKSLHSVKLSAIPFWPSPTKAREYDGAAHCKIAVSTKKNKYESQSFDGGNPMKQLKPLYNAIDSIRNFLEADGKEYAAATE